MGGFGEISERLRRSTVRVVSGKRPGFGSGIIWNAAGTIVTNSHVASHGDQQVELWDGRRFAARIASRDPRRDLAILQIQADHLEPVTPGNSSAVKPGELVIAVGNPMGFAGAVSTGVVHSVGKLAGMGRQNWILANVRLAPGNSGGPLADAEGRVIGINTAIVNGLGVAAPSDAARDLLRAGPRPSLGVVLQPVSLGLLLLEVEEGSAAAEASLKSGDLLLISMDDLNDALDSGREALRLQFLRGDRRLVRETVVRLQRRAVAA
jgi:serine protease Do